jgi:recombination protein RecA
MCIYYRSKLTHNEPILLVADSIATWETQANMDAADMDSGEDMGRRAKMIYRVIRKRLKIFSKYGICCVFINQLRNRPTKTKWEDPETSPGGLAMRYYASIRAAVKKSKFIMDENKTQVGQEVYIKIKKNKIAEPKPSIRGKVHFKTHNDLFAFDNYAYLAEPLVNLKVIKRKSARFYYKGKEIAHGDLAFDKLLRRDEALRKKLISKSGIMTISKARTILEATKGTNRYPVKLKAKADDDKEEAEDE